MLRSLCHCLSRAAAPRRPSRPSCKLAPRRARPTPRARPQREGGNVRISRMMWSHTCHNSHTQSVCTVYHIKHAFHTRLDTYNFVIADAGSHVLNGATPRPARGGRGVPDAGDKYLLLLPEPAVARHQEARAVLARLIARRLRATGPTPSSSGRCSAGGGVMSSGGSTRRRWRRCRR